MQAPVAESHFECRCGAVEEDGRIRRHCQWCGYHTVMPANYCMDCGKAFAIARVVEVVELPEGGTRKPLALHPTPRKRMPWSENEEEKMFQLAASGYSSREIAEALGRSVAAIVTRRYCRVVA